MTLQQLIKFGMHNEDQHVHVGRVADRMGSIGWMPDVREIDPASAAGSSIIGSRVTLIPGDQPLALESGERLDQATNTLITEDLGKSGTEALALYVPFHTGLRNWGVYLRASGVLFIAESLYDTAKVSQEQIEAARRLLTAHEMFHGRTEFAATTVEVVTGDSVYARYAQDESAATPEESGANVVAMRGLEKGLQSNAGIIFDAQPDHYRHWRKYRKSLPRAMREMARVMRSRIPSNSIHTMDVSADASLWPEDDEFLHRVVPQYLVQDISGAGPFVTKEFPKQFGIKIDVYTNDHLPPHFHLKSSSGDDFGSYRWPSLLPVKSSMSPLTNKMLKTLDKYLANHGQKIEKQLIEVFGADEIGFAKT